MIKMVIKYQTSDGKLFDNEAAARDHENVTFEVKYFSDDYTKDGELRLCEYNMQKVIDEDYDDPALAVLEECYAIFVPSNEVLGSLCHHYSGYMPDYDKTNLVPHPGYYIWVNAEECFIPVEALNRLSNWELQELDLYRPDINYLMRLEREAGLEI